MKAFLIGSTVGWILSSFYLIGTNTANAGTLIMGGVIAFAWLAYAAGRARA